MTKKQQQLSNQQQPTDLDSFKRQAIEKLYQGKPLIPFQLINDKLSKIFVKVALKRRSCFF